MYGRKLYIDIPAADFNKQMDLKIRKLSATANVKGFRPGKVPTDVIKRQYGAAVEREVLNTLMLDSYNEAVEQHSLHSMITPAFDDMEVDKDTGVKFTVYIEMIPDLQLDLENVQVEKPTCEIVEADIDKMVERVRRNHATWKPKTGAAAMGDKLTLDIKLPKSTDDSAADENSDYSDQTLILGSHYFGDHVDRQLVGVSAGEEREVELKPADEEAADTNDKPLYWKANIKLVEEIILPQLDDDFYKACHIEEGGMEALRRSLRDGMEWELKEKLAKRFRGNVHEAVLKHNDIEVPPTMLKEQIASMKREMSEDSDTVHAEIAKLEDKFFEETASNRVRLKVMFLHLTEKYDFKADRQSCEIKSAEIAAKYADTGEIMNYYRNDEKGRQMVEAMVLEDKVMDFLIEKVTTIDKAYSFQEIMEPNSAKTDDQDNGGEK